MYGLIEGLGPGGRLALTQNTLIVGEEEVDGAGRAGSDPAGPAGHVTTRSLENYDSSYLLVGHQWAADVEVALRGEMCSINQYNDVPLVVT